MREIMRVARRITIRDVQDFAAFVLVVMAAVLLLSVGVNHG